MAPPMDIPNGPPELSVVIPTHNTVGLTLEAVNSVVAGPANGLEVIVVDDGSTDNTTETLQSHHPDVVCLRHDRPLGFSAAANRGLNRARGRFLLLLNSDAVVEPGGLEALLRAFSEDPAGGIIGARMSYPDGTPQWSGGAWPTLFWLFALTSALADLAGRLPLYRRLKPPGAVRDPDVDWVTGAAMAIRSEVWEQCGPLDEGYRFYGQDLDFCFRADRAGWGVRLCPDFRVIHHHGATIGGTGGATDRDRPDVLWSDLLRFVERSRGTEAARRARSVMLAGGRLRLALSAVSLLFGSRSRRSAIRTERTAYRRALDGLARRSP